MTAVKKIDSNGTGLRFAIENPDGTLPASPTWFPLEPNSYDKFGGAIKTVARNPINDSRQRKKGVVVDLDANAGFEMDVTSDNLTRLMQGFLFAATRTKAELSATVVGSALDDYQPAAGGDSYYAGNLLFAKNYSQAANNGLKTVTGTPSATSVPVLPAALADENAAGGIISRVGHEFGAGIATIDVSGALPKLVVSGIAAASNTLTVTGQPANGEQVTIGSRTYTFQTALVDVDGNVKIGGTAAASLINLRNAINLNGVGVVGVDFAASTTVNAQVTATSTATTLVATAIVAGTPGNTIATTKTYALATWTGATLAGGTGRSLIDLGLIPGEWVCLGDDTTVTQFVNAANNGLKRVRAIANSSLTFDKSTVAMVTDAGTAKTIRVFFGRVQKNERGSAIVRQLVQFERLLGAPDTSSTAQQSEYLTGSIANEFDLTMKTADKVTAKLSYMSNDQETRTAGQGVKPGVRPLVQDADAYNSSSHVARLSLAAIDPLTATPTDLFAFLLDLSVSIKNNVKANKAIKFLGSFDHTAGTFEVSAKMTAYFSTVDAIRSVRNNANVTLDMTFNQANKGFTIDIPLTSLATDGADIKQDEAVMLPLQSDAATASSIDTNLNHTLLLVYWDYLPSLAA
jgi:hypothetical protein